MIDSQAEPLSGRFHSQISKFKNLKERGGEVGRREKRSVDAE